MVTPVIAHAQRAMDLTEKEGIRVEFMGFIEFLGTH